MAMPGLIDLIIGGLPGSLDWFGGSATTADANNAITAIAAIANRKSNANHFASA